MLNGKKYIGQTTRTLEQRFKEHQKNIFSTIGKAINSDGVENFQSEILEKCKTISELNEREIFWIEKFNSLAPNGYNKTPGGGNFFRTPLQIQKLFRKNIFEFQESERVKELQQENENLRQLLLIAQSKLIKSQEELNENQKMLSDFEKKFLAAESQSKDSQAELTLEQALHKVTTQQLEDSKRIFNETKSQLENQLDESNRQLEKIKNRGLFDRIFNNF